MMNFRSVIITVLLVGTALLLPTDAMAKKENILPKPAQQNSHLVELPDTANNPVQASVNEEKAKSMEKPNKGQLREQAKEHAQNAVHIVNKNANKTTKQTLPTVAEVKQGEKKEQAKAKNKLTQHKKVIQPKKKQVEKTVEKPIEKPNDDKGIEVESHTPMKIIQNPKVANGTSQPVEKNEDTSKKTTSEQSAPQEEKPPQPHEKYPVDVQIIHSEQQTKTPGSSSKDRTSNSQNASHFNEKWLEIEKQLSLNLIQSYGSRERVFQNQWINAPPSQPPKNALFF
ncbi:hypothetical protein LC040_10955 [Bacillus tianshenii]|nr:hypothetical protein LC040_10955 [Bacillus tianshenii]